MLPSKLAPYAPAKSATDPTVDTVKQLRSFRADYPEATCMVICRTPRSYVSEGIEFFSLPEAVRVLSAMG